MSQLIANRNRRTQSGLALIALGTILILANVGVIAGFLANLEAQAIGAPAAATLAILQFLRAAAFHPAALLPFVCGILILFLAFAGVLSGVILLGTRNGNTVSSTVENA
jgi:hypothetical protein